ncbi:MAG: type II toxin-antitoxin system Y4mF family antitoxin [Longimicrobiales bacterium]|nr:type II toxin-antitoxin system Y4mF family antitoxin [Longimicrobiales bacterium]
MPADKGVLPTEGRSVAHLADTVRSRRKALGLLQAELADLAGCSERFVHTVENGKTSLRLDKLLDALKVLGLDLVVVVGQGGDEVTRVSAAVRAGER